jgi:hypothetical protein
MPRGLAHLRGERRCVGAVIPDPMRREDEIIFRPRDSGGGGPLELAKRANRGGGGAGLSASLPLQVGESKQA